jgi:DNA polymerase elongation subunit (family B)
MSRLRPETRDAIDHLRETKGWGYKRIADALEVTYAAVRWYVEAEGAKQYPDPMPLRTVVWDLETSNLKTDMGTLLVASFLDISRDEIETVHIECDQEHGNIAAREKRLIQQVLGMYVNCDVLIGHNTLTFDVPFLRGCAARYGLGTLPPRFHIDSYQVARHGLKAQLQSYSLDNLGDFFGVGVKNRPSKHEWRGAGLLDEPSILSLVARCEADVRLNAAVWDCLKPYWFTWRGR